MTNKGMSHKDPIGQKINYINVHIVACMHTKIKPREPIS
jgi:hypothetical protein